MSASSNCVTWGIFTQLACRRGPAISGCASVGVADRAEGRKVDLAQPAARLRPSRGRGKKLLTCAFTSSGVIRPLRPCRDAARSTPSSRANAAPMDSRARVKAGLVDDGCAALGRYAGSLLLSAPGCARVGPRRARVLPWLRWAGLLRGADSGDAGTATVAAATGASGCADSSSAIRSPFDTDRRA